MRLLISGNSGYGVAQAIDALLGQDHDCLFASRATGYDLVTTEGKKRFVKESLSADVVINSSALHNFHQTILARDVVEAWQSASKKGYIINIGSSADRAVKSGSWLYPIEKIALREFSANVSTDCIWNKTGIRCTYLSFGTVNTPKVAAKHPERAKLSTAYTAEQIAWLISQPDTLNISICNIDPINHS